jgi:hypothetical protein
MHVTHQKKELVESVEVDEITGFKDFHGEENGSIVSA